MGGHYWVECPQCGRESYAAETEANAIYAWFSDVGQKGRSNLIAELKASAGVASRLAIEKGTGIVYALQTQEQMSTKPPNFNFG